MQLIENIKDLASYADLPLIDKILAGLLIAIIGMTITFIVLIVIWLMIRLISNVENRMSSLKRDTQDGGTEAPEAKSGDPAAKTDSLMPARSACDNLNNAEVNAETVAVIVAAIAQFTGTGEFKIRHISRKRDEVPSWRSEGL